MPGGWQGGAPASNWEPAFAGARQVTNTGYARGADQVDLWLGYYRGQGYDRKLVSSVNLMVEPTTESRWMLVARSNTTLAVGSQTVPLRMGDVRERAQGATGQRLRVWQVYAIQGQLLTSDVRARLQLALNRLKGRGDDGAVIFLSTPLPDESPEARAAADVRLKAYTEASLPTLLQALESTRQQGTAR
jgi:EpsI family protein